MTVNACQRHMISPRDGVGGRLTEYQGCAKYDMVSGLYNTSCRVVEIGVSNCRHSAPVNGNDADDVDEK